MRDVWTLPFERDAVAPKWEFPAGDWERGAWGRLLYPDEKLIFYAIGRITKRISSLPSICYKKSVTKLVLLLPIAAIRLSGTVQSKYLNRQEIDHQHTLEELLAS